MFFYIIIINVIDKYDIHIIVYTYIMLTHSIINIVCKYRTHISYMVPSGNLLHSY